MERKIKHKSTEELNMNHFTKGIKTIERKIKNKSMEELNMNLITKGIKQIYNNQMV